MAKSHDADEPAVNFQTGPKHIEVSKGDSHLINQTHSPSRARLFGGSATVAVAAMLIAGPAFAQVKTAAAAAEDDSTIIVTGSLIKNPNLTRSAPVNVTTSEEINLKQTNVAEDLLRDIPGIVPNIGSAVNNGNGGASFVDLRGLGSNRNIVLLDGARIAPSGLVGRVDLNNIPLALVDRVEVLTGGASTTYGADAISGVVNFITKRDFTGIEATASNQLTQRGDGKYFRTDVTIGGNFADGKGNATLSVGFQESDPVYQGDREFGAFNISSFTGNVSGSGTTVPSRFTGTRTVVTGTTNPNTLPAFSGFDPVTGLLIPVVGGANNPGSRQILPSNGTAVAQYAPFNFNPYNIYQTPFRRYNIFGTAHYEVSPALEVYTRALFSKNTVSTIIAPSGSFGTSVTLNLNNPYLPAALRNQFCAFNTAPAVNSPVLNAQGNPVANGVISYTPLFTPAQCAAAATATGPSDPNYRTVTTALSRRLVEAGPRISVFETTIFDYKVGARGTISDHLSYDVSGAYGESNNVQTLSGYVLTSRLRNAVLANNTTTCQNGSADGCVPLNIFGVAGTITPAQANYLQAASSTTVRTSLAQVKGGVSGDFGFASPFAADSINFAVGAEYRKYQAHQDSDLLGKTPGELGGAGGVAPKIDGGYEVTEVYGELIAPLVQDKPFFHNLTASGGIRYSHYTVNAPTSPSYNTTTYKGELGWEPVQGIKLRANYSRAVRAPNISELFTPVTVGLTSLQTDPCAGGAPNTNANLRAVCLAQGAPANTIGSITNPTAAQANISTGGNINVKPETSDSYTLGGVLAPTFLPGFSVSVDYYHIQVKNAITVPAPTDLINACFGAPVGGVYSPAASAASSNACTIIRRNPITGGLDGPTDTTLGLFGGLTNQGKLLTDGIDVILNYRRDIGFAKLALAFNGNYTFRSNFLSNQNAPVDVNNPDRNCTGLYSVNCASIQPKFQWNQRTTLGFDRFDVSLLWRHIDSVNYEFAGDPNNRLYSGPFPSGTNSLGVPPGSLGNTDFNHIKAYDYFDLSFRVDVMKSLELTFVVQNLFDRQPPAVGSGAGTTGFNSGNTYPSSYDSLGRKFAVGAKLKF